MIDGLSFHHVGIACKSLEKDVGVYSTLGFRQEGEVFEDHQQCIRGLFMLSGSYRVELLEGLGVKSPLTDYLKRGIRMYHHAFTCHDLENAIASLERDRARVVVPPVPAIAFGGRRICFVMMKDLSLIELIEAE